MTSEADERCLLHARIAARQAIMKGLDRELLANAFLIEALKLAFGLEDSEAAHVAQRWKEQVFGQLDADYVAVGADGRPRIVRLLRSESRSNLMGSTALTSRA